MDFLKKIRPLCLREAFIVGGCLIIGVKWGKNEEKGEKRENTGHLFIYYLRLTIDDFLCALSALCGSTNPRHPRNPRLIVVSRRSYLVSGIPCQSALIGEIRV